METPLSRALSRFPGLLTAEATRTVVHFQVDSAHKTIGGHLAQAMKPGGPLHLPVRAEVTVTWSGS